MCKEDKVSCYQQICVLVLMQELSSTQSKEHLTEPGTPKHTSSDTDGDAGEKEQQPSTKKEKDLVRQSESAESEGSGSSGGGSHDSV